MDRISQNLERHYSAFIEEPQAFEFFTGLSDYLNYVKGELKLNAIVEKVLEKKKSEYAKIAELEEKSIKELQEAKGKLLKVIKKRKIEPSKLQGDHASIHYSENIIRDLERLENGEIHTGNFYSDALEGYLWAIAVGIAQLGYKDDIKEFEDPNKYPQNIYGNYTFSQTLPLRYKQGEAIERSRILEIWGTFDWLQKFQVAFSELAQNTPWGEIAPKYVDDSRNHPEMVDAVDIMFFAEELKNLMGLNRSILGRSNVDIHHMKVPVFKNHTKRVHAYLLKELSINDSTGNFEPGIKELKVNLNEKWWKNGEKPSYKKDSAVMSLGNRHVQIPLGSNQGVLCEALFDIPLGEWLKDINVRDKFYTDTESAFYNTVRAINESAKDNFDIEELLQYKASRTRVRDELFKES